VKTGAGRRVWIADTGAGSVFNPTLSEDNLFWTSHDQLVFPWEKTGWLHLYAVPVQGGTARAITSGKFEVTRVVFSPDRKRLVYSSSQDDTDRMHVWTVDAEHGQPAPAAKSRAIEDYPQTSADGTLFALQSDGNQALHPVVLSAKGQWQPLAPEAIPASFPVSKLVMPELVTFTAKDGHETRSYGGLMTALGLARASDALAAGVDYAGLYNWATLLASVGEPIDDADATRRAVESSPVATIDKWHSPVLIVQADDDRNVPSQQATELIEGLRAHNIDHDEIVIPNEIHDLTRRASWLLLFNAADAYFDRHLDKLGAKSP
jgi:dipeptidyl aminopeptidase/acylaminoacyl peptidase